MAHCLGLTSLTAAALDAGLRAEAAAARRQYRAGRPLRHHPRAAAGARHPYRRGPEPVQPHRLRRSGQEDGPWLRGPRHRTLQAFPNTNMKACSEDGSTLTQPRLDSTAFRKLNSGRNDDEDKVHWTVKTLEKMNTRDRSILQEDLQIFIPGGQAAEPHAGLGPGPLFRSCSRRCTRRTTRSLPRSRCRPTRAAPARRHHREGRPLRLILAR